MKPGSWKHPGYLNHGGGTRTVCRTLQWVPEGLSLPGEATSGYREGRVPSTALPCPGSSSREPREQSWQSGQKGHTLITEGPGTKGLLFMNLFYLQPTRTALDGSKYNGTNREKIAFSFFKLEEALSNGRNGVTSQWDFLQEQFWLLGSFPGRSPQCHPGGPRTIFSQHFLSP